MKNLARYRKTIVALIGAGIIIMSRHLGPDAALVVDVETLATALGVYAVPNSRP